MTDQLIEFITNTGLDRTIELIKLKDSILKTQAKIEHILDDVAALEWPDNIFGRMYDAIDNEDIAQMIVILAEWQQWLDKVPPKAERVVSRMMARLEMFIDDYGAGNDAG